MHTHRISGSASDGSIRQSPFAAGFFDSECEPQRRRLEHTSTWIGMPTEFLRSPCSSVDGNIVTCYAGLFPRILTVAPPRQGVRLSVGRLIIEVGAQIRAAEITSPRKSL